MKELKDYTYKELKALYPNAKGNSKKKLLKSINELVEETMEEVEEAVNDDSMSVDEAIEYVKNHLHSYKKTLLKFDSSWEADEFIITLKYDVIPELEEEGVIIMLNERRRELHLNGKYYVRCVCKKNYDLVKTLARFNDYKTVS